MNLQSFKFSFHNKHRTTREIKTSPASHRKLKKNHHANRKGLGFDATEELQLTNKGE